MFKKIINLLFKDFYLFTAAYSNNIFPEPLSKDEEEECIKKLLNKDRDARNKLIEHNLRLVAHIVKKYDHKTNDIDDLISIGTIGLIKGIDSFSNKHGTKITTYCARCIENATITCWNDVIRLILYLLKYKNTLNQSLINTRLKKCII